MAISWQGDYEICLSQLGLPFSSLPSEVIIFKAARRRARTRTPPFSTKETASAFSKEETELERVRQLVKSVNEINILLLHQYLASSSSKPSRQAPHRELQAYRCKMNRFSVSSALLRDDGNPLNLLP
ncbi:hypothetical protein Bca101_073595 [Brassica carinata]